MATIRIISLADGDPSPFDGQYVAEYDPHRDGVAPDGRPMICHLVTTPDREKALDLEAGKAFELWRKSCGMREDGKPNRPLTAFTVEIS